MASSEDHTWKTNIRRKLSVLFVNDPEALTTILQFLGEEDDRLSHCTDISPAWEILRTTTRWANTFQVQAERLVEHIRQADGDDSHREVLNDSIMEMLEALWSSDEMGTTDEFSWKDDVQWKLMDVFGDSLETLRSILSYLEDGSSSEDDFTDVSHAWRTLYSIIDSDQVFKTYAEGLVPRMGNADDAIFENPDDDTSIPKITSKDSTELLDDYAWKDSVLGKLIDIFEDDPETLDNILSFIEENDGQENPPVWVALYSVMDSDDAFKEYAKSMIKAPRRAVWTDDVDEYLDLPSSDSKRTLLNSNDDIRDKLLRMLDDGSEAAATIVHRLVREDEKYNEGDETGISSVWEILKSTYHSDEMFKECVEHLAKDTGTAADSTNTASSHQWSWRDDIRSKLCGVFATDGESLRRILRYLDAEDKASISDQSPAISPVWNILRSALYSDNVFQEYAKRVAEDTKKAENDESFRESMDVYYLQMMDPLWVPADIALPINSSWKAEIRTKLIGMFEHDDDILDSVFDQMLDDDQAWTENITSDSPVWNNLGGNDREMMESLCDLEDAALLDDDSWKDDIRSKLMAISEDADSTAMILFYLDEEDKEYNGSGIEPPVWKFLKNALYSDEVFRAYAEHLAEDVQKAVDNAEFRETLHIVYSQMLEPLDEPVPASHAQGFEFPRVSLTELVAKPSAKLIVSKVTNPRAVQVFDRVARVVAKPAFLAGAAVVYLGIKSISSVRRWWAGTISGKRCMKEILDSSASFAAGLAGGAVGSACGLVASPVGSIFAGLAGSFMAMTAMEWLFGRFTQWLFNIPKDEALENAYNFLGVQMTASNNEVNKVYRRLCLQHHPDKSGGDSDGFLLLQMHIAVIREARKGI